MKEATFLTDSGPTCQACHGSRPGYGCWKYRVRQRDNDDFIVVQATCYICQAVTHFQANVDTNNLDELTAAEVRQAHNERAEPILEGKWQTWAFQCAVWPVWFCPFCDESTPHYDWWEGENSIRQCQRCGVKWTRYGKSLE